MQGEATLVTCGTVVAPRRIAPDEIGVKEIEGGESRHIVPGDVIVVPNGVPHWFKPVAGPLQYYVIKVRSQLTRRTDMKRITFSIAIVTLLCIAGIAPAQEAKRYLNVDRNGVALHGFDPVAYFTQHKAIKGDKTIASTYRGATYHFASQEDKEKFDAEPVKYEPQFGGFCGYAVSEGHTADIDPEAFVISGDRLILQYSKRVLKMWNQDPENRLKKAESNWPAIAEKNGK